MLREFKSRFSKRYRIDNTEIDNTYDIHNLQTCTVTIDADTLTAMVGVPVTLTVTVSPPGTYDVNFKYGGDPNPINPVPIPTDINGVATLPLNTAGKTPGPYDIIAEVVNPISCISSPITLMLTNTICGGISITNPPGLVTAYIGDIIPVSISATITEPSIAELRVTELSDMRIGSCVLDPLGNCIINADTTGAPPGTYHVAAYVGYGSAQQCVSPPVEVTLQYRPGKIVVISIPPGASIYYDNNDTGLKSSAIISDVTPNISHEVKLTLSGYQDYIEPSIILSPGGTGSIFAMLVPVISPTGTGNLNVTSVPDGVEFGLYTGEIGTAPVTLNDIPAGINAYEAGLTGYNGAMGSLIIKSGETTNLNIPLQLSTPDMGIVAIESIPMGADIYIDGLPINTKTSFMTFMIPGPHTYELRLSGYQSKSGEFTVVSGYDMPVIVSERLQSVSGAGMAVMLIGGAVVGIMLMTSK